MLKLDGRPTRKVYVMLCKYRGCFLSDPVVDHRSLESGISHKWLSWSWSHLDLWSISNLDWTYVERYLRVNVGRLLVGCKSQSHSNSGLHRTYIMWCSVWKISILTHFNRNKTMFYLFTHLFWGSTKEVILLSGMITLVRETKIGLGKITSRV